MGGREIKKGGRRGSWMEPPRFFCLEMGGGISTSHSPHLTEASGATPSPRHPDTPTLPHLTHIDEDALEGVYFEFSTILRCLPYFLRKTRPRASYELLEAFSPSLTADRVSVG